jgi:glutathionyl-hydroquinone reductase
MGRVVDGVWVENPPPVAPEDGRFHRVETQFRSWVTADGSAGPTGEGGFRAEPGRYHLYVSLACPWAHRTLVLRALKRLDDVVSVTVVDPLMGANGWAIPEDPVNGARFLYEVYVRAVPRYSGRASVPVLWDKQRRTIVNNESAEIIRMLNWAFDAFTPVRDDYCPEALRPEIDRVNAYVYANVNNGVYRTGFAKTQSAYEESFLALFKALDWLEERLSRQRYLVGDRPTEADWRLFTTLIRFDAVYFGHFKCNLRRIIDYAQLPNYLRDLYQVPRIAETVNIDHIKRHYYWSHRTINPTGIVPLGPELDFAAPHDRARFG